MLKSKSALKVSLAVLKSALWSPVASQETPTTPGAQGTIRGHNQLYFLLFK